MFKKKTDETQLDIEIQRIAGDMALESPNSEEYLKLLTAYERLTKLRDSESRSKIDPNTWVTVGANLAGIVLILNHERINVISTKAVSFVSKMKI